MATENTGKKINVILCYENNNGGETVITELLRNELNKFEDLNIRSFHLPPVYKTDLFNYYYWVFKSICQWLIITVKRKNTCIFYTTTFTAGVSALLLKRFKKYKIFFHYHGSRIPPKNSREGLYHRVGQFLKYHLSFRLHRIFIKYCDAIITPTKAAKSELIKQFPFVDQPKIKIIPNGINLRKFAPVKTNKKMLLRKKLGIPPKARVILNIGRINTDKNNIKLVRVLEHVLMQENNCILIYAHPPIYSEYDAIYKNNILEKIRKKNLGNNIIWKVNYKNIEELYKISDLAVSLSKHEILSTTMLEAFASGVIVLSTPPGRPGNINKQIDDELILNNLSPSEVCQKIVSLLRKQTIEKIKIQKVQREIVKGFGLNKFSFEVYSLFKT